MKLQKQEQQQQETEQISPELISKFDDDKQLVQEFLNQGYSVEELQGSVITHPTKYDPVCLVNGESIGMWLYSDNNHNTNNRIKYTNSRF